MSLAGLESILGLRAVRWTSKVRGMLEPDAKKIGIG